MQALGHACFYCNADAGLSLPLVTPCSGACCAAAQRSSVSSHHCVSYVANEGCGTAGSSSGTRFNVLTVTSLLSFKLASAKIYERASRPDVILVLSTGSNHTPHAHVQDLPPSNWDIHFIEFKYCDDTQPESQLQKAEEQHRRLVAILKAQGCSKVSLHVVLMGWHRFGRPPFPSSKALSKILRTLSASSFCLSMK